jgi:hypothetical protein
MPYLDTVDADVLTCIEGARRSALEQQVECVIEWLSKAVSIYEENPTVAHGAESQLGDLLLYIEATLRACDSCELEKAAADLQARAIVLESPLH